MRVVCPSCGAMSSLEALLTDADARLFVAALTRLPAPVLPTAPRYIALFRPQTGRALQWRKATRLVDELYGIIQPGHVHRQGQPDRPCPPGIWAQAMERMAATPPSRLPLKSHNYMAAIAWDLADAADRQGEKVRDREHLAIKREPSDLTRPTAPMDVAEMRRIRAQNMRRKQ